MNPTYGIVIWFVIGGFAGWIASRFMGSREGLFADIVLGIVGATTVGFATSGFLGDEPEDTGLIVSILIALGGACAMLFLGRRVLRRAFIARST